MPHSKQPRIPKNMHPTPLPSTIKLSGPNGNIASKVKKGTS